MENKFYEKCICCNFIAYKPSMWNKHLNTEKHKRKGQNKTNNYICKICGYYSANNFNFNVHYILTHACPQERKQKAKFYCESCDVGFFCKLYYDTHIKSIKHAKKINIITNSNINYMDYIIKLENDINLISI